jgi:hypothetical protein
VTPRCGRVSPYWVQLGWVKFADHPQREKLMNIEYRRCPRDGDTLLRHDGFTFEVCPEHAAEIAMAGPSSGTP